MSVAQRLTGISLAIVALAATAAPAGAQTSRAHIGPHLSYNFDIEEVAIGPQLGIPIGPRLEFYPSFDWYLVNNGSLWGLNTDLKYRVGGQGMEWFYLGGGLNLMGRNPDNGRSRTDANANLFLGAESLAGRVHPFAEFRAILGDGSSAQVAFGLNFTLRSR